MKLNGPRTSAIGPAVYVAGCHPGHPQQLQDNGVSDGQQRLAILLERCIRDERHRFRHLPALEHEAAVRQETGIPSRCLDFAEILGDWLEKVQYLACAPQDKLKYCHASHSRASCFGTSSPMYKTDLSVFAP